MANKQARAMTEMIMAYFKVNYKVAKRYERFSYPKQPEEIKSWDKK